MPQIGSRFVRNKPKPIVTLRLDTVAQPSSSDPPVRRLSCVRADYDNLRNLHQQLETALREADATHASRIQRYLH